MKNLNKNINYVVDVIIAVFLSFSIVYALSVTWEMTYSAKDVLILISLVSVGYSIALANRLSLKITALASALVGVGGLLYFSKNPSVIDLVYIKITSTFLWFTGFINKVEPLNMEYQNYVLLALSMGVSLIVYIYTVKRFNFYVLLIGGVSLFVAQWLLEYFIIYLSFYVFVFFILVCYFKHIYLKNTAAGQSSSSPAPAGFLLFSAPICALVFLFAYFMPASDKPLEWNWMNTKISSAQNFVQTNYNIESEYFSIYSTGFSEESSRLGGNISLNNTLVMKVDSPEGGIYLKGAVRDIYTGYSWESSDSELISIGENLRLDDLNVDLFNNNILNKFFNKTSINITYENLRTKTLFIPVKTENLKFEEEPINLLLNSYGMPSSETPLGNQFQYSVELYSMKKNNENLTQLLRNSSSGLYNSYLQLPAGLPTRVGELAHEITSSAKSDYDRAKAIESYLSMNYMYTLEPGKVPNHRDLVDYFLFDHKQGYCTYYASAMTVLARSIGIPARYVEGYVLPSRPTQGITYDVTNKQAHAWVEVYFEGFGWIPFEPTSSSSQNFLGSPDASEESVTTETPSETLETTETPQATQAEASAAETSEQATNTDSSTPDQPDNAHNPTDDISISQDPYAFSSVSTDIFTGTGRQILTFIKIAGPAVLAFLLWAAGFSPLRRKFRLQRAQMLTPRQSVIKMYKHYLNALSLQGLKIKPGETPLQYAQRIDENLDFKPISFKSITDAFIKARYSNIPVNKNERQLLIDFQSTFYVQYKERAGRLRYFVCNNLLGLI